MLIPSSASANILFGIFLSFPGGVFAVFYASIRPFAPFVLYKSTTVDLIITGMAELL